LKLTVISQISETCIEPLVTQPSAFEFEMAIEKLKRHKSLGIDQIPAEFIKAGSRKISSVIRKL